MIREELHTKSVGDSRRPSIMLLADRPVAPKTATLVLGAMTAHLPGERGSLLHTGDERPFVDGGV